MSIESDRERYEDDLDKTGQFSGDEITHMADLRFGPQKLSDDQQQLQDKYSHLRGTTKKARFSGIKPDKLRQEGRENPEKLKEDAWKAAIEMSKLACDLCDQTGCGLRGTGSLVTHHLGHYNESTAFLKNLEIAKLTGEDVDCLTLLGSEPRTPAFGKRIVHVATPYNSETHVEEHDGEIVVPDMTAEEIDGGEPDYSVPEPPDMD